MSTPSVLESTRAGLRRVLHCCWPVCILLFAFIAPPARAQAAEPKYSFDVPAGEAKPMLRQFAAQAKREIIIAVEAVDGIRTHAVKGEMTARQAADQMLADTGLVATQDPKTGAFAVRKADPNAPRAAQTNSDRPGENNSAAPKDEKVLMMGVYEVKGKKPFADANVDLVRSMNDPLPYIMFKGETIQQSGATSVDDFLKQRLTMNSNATSSTNLTPQFANQQTSGIDLRGLGTNQTLILVNGRRQASFGLSGQLLQVDLNGIPLASIERIEVLPASVAGIYGGSAVGGVINVVLKRDYAGAEINTKWENTFDSDAPLRTLDVSAGFTLEKGRTHVTIAGHYSDGSPLLDQDRPELVADRLEIVNRNNSAALYTATNPYLGATPNIGASTNLTLKNGTPLNSNLTSIPAGTSAATPAATLNSGLLANAGQYNRARPDTIQHFGNLEPMGVVPRLDTAQVGIRRAMTTNLEVFAEFSYSGNHVRTVDDRLPTISVPATAPTSPFQQTVTVRAPLALAMPVVKDLLSRRSTAGFTLNLPHDWKAEADYTWSMSAYSSAIPSSSFSSNLAAAIASGAINPFVDTLANPPDLTPFVGRISSAFSTTMHNVGLRLAGPLGRLPWGGEPLLAIGLEYRREAHPDFLSDTVFAGFPASSTQTLFPGKSQAAASAYAELQWPLVAPGKGRPGLRQLDLQLAGRSEDYVLKAATSSVQLIPVPTTPQPVIRTRSHLTSTNPTIGLRYKPLEGLTLRGSYGTGFLPPSLTQLVPNANPSNTNITDPKRGSTSYIVPALGGGNPALKPELSRNWSAGIIFEPKFLSGFRAALDWYQIKKSDRIGLPTGGAQGIVDLEALFPGLVTRGAPAAGDPFGVGAITFIDARSQNLTKLETSGYDLTFEWRRPTQRWGTFDLFLLGTKITSYKVQAAVNSPLVEQVNFVLGGGGPIELKANGTLTWEFHRWSAGWTANYYGSYHVFGPPITTVTTFVLAQGSSDRVSSQLTHNFVVGYTPGRSKTQGRARLWDNLSVQVGIKNVFDAAPPFYGGVAIAVFPYSPFGDPRMRSWWLSVRKSF